MSPIKLAAHYELLLPSRVLVCPAVSIFKPDVYSVCLICASEMHCPYHHSSLYGEVVAIHGYDLICAETATLYNSPNVNAGVNMVLCVVQTAKVHPFYHCNIL